MPSFINLLTINSSSYLPLSSPFSSFQWPLFVLPALVTSTPPSTIARLVETPEGNLLKASSHWRKSSDRWHLDFQPLLSLVFFLTSGAFSSGCPTILHLQGSQLPLHRAIGKWKQLLTLTHFLTASALWEPFRDWTWKLLKRNLQPELAKEIEIMCTPY